MTDKTDAELDELEYDLRKWGPLRHEDAAIAIASLRKQLDEAREREAMMAAALGMLKTAFRVNMLRVWPEADVDAAIATAFSQEPPASHALETDH
jgi:hypothetical protein